MAKVKNDVNSVIFFGIAALMSMTLPVLALITAQVMNAKNPNPDVLARNVSSKITCEEGYRPALNCPVVEKGRNPLQYCNWDCVEKPHSKKGTDFPDVTVCPDVMCPLDCPAIELPNGCPTCWCSEY